MLHVTAGNNDGEKPAQRRWQYPAHFMAGRPCYQRQTEIIFMQLFQECSGTNDKSQTGDPFEIDLFFFQYFVSLAVVERLTVLRGEFPDAVDAALPLAAIYVIVRHRDPYSIENDFPGAEMIRHGVGDNPVHVQDNGMDVKSQACHEYDYIKLKIKDKGF